MKNRVSLEGYGEILAGRIARPYEKGTPRAKQGDEYWFFIKHFASISREKASEGVDGDRARDGKRERQIDGEDWRKGNDGRERRLGELTQLSQTKEKGQHFWLESQSSSGSEDTSSKYKLVSNSAHRCTLFPLVSSNVVWQRQHQLASFANTFNDFLCHTSLSASLGDDVVI